MAGKAAKEQKKLGKISDKLKIKAADKVISGKDTRRLTEKYGSPLVATALAKMGIANPDLQFKNNVKRITGLKFKGEGEDRYASYNPSRIKTLRPITGYPGFGNTDKYRTKVFGSGIDSNTPMARTGYGANWYRTANGSWRYGGPAGDVLPGEETTDTTTANTPIVDELPEEEEMMLPEEDPIEPLRLDASQYGVGADIPSFTRGWKGRKSQRKKAGKSAQGYNSMTTAPASNAAGVGLNPGPWKSTYIPYMT